MHSLCVLPYESSLKNEIRELPTINIKQKLMHIIPYN